MRFIVIEQALDLQAWRARLINPPEAGHGGPQPLSPQALAQMKALNPHVDLQRLQLGSVLLLPDTPELDAAGARSLAGEAFEGFAAQVAEGCKAVAQRIRLDAQARADERSEVAKLLRTPALRRQSEGDELLRRQLGDVQAEFDSAQASAGEAAGQVEALQENAASELAQLGKMFGLLN